MKPLRIHAFFVVGLLYCVAGCDSRPWNSTVPFYGNSIAFGGWGDFNVGEIKYKCLGICRSDAGGRENLSWIVVSPAEEKKRYSIEIASDQDSVKGFICCKDSEDNEISRIETPPNTVFLCKNGEIIHSKTNKDLELDISDAKTAFSQEHLQPILEKLIRENVKTKE